MFPSPIAWPSRANTAPVSVFTVKRGFSEPVDPYERCFYAVCAALKGQPGVIKAMQAIVAASKGGGEARHA